MSPKESTKRLRASSEGRPPAVLALVKWTKVVPLNVETPRSVAIQQ
jgi:hypothetical protein